MHRCIHPSIPSHVQCLVYLCSACIQLPYVMLYMLRVVHMLLRLSTLEKKESTAVLAALGSAAAPTAPQIRSRQPAESRHMPIPPPHLPTTLSGVIALQLYLGSGRTACGRDNPSNAESSAEQPDPGPGLFPVQSSPGGGLIPLGYCYLGGGYLLLLFATPRMPPLRRRRPPRPAVQPEIHGYPVGRVREWCGVEKEDASCF